MQSPLDSTLSRTFTKQAAQKSVLGSLSSVISSASSASKPEGRGLLKGLASQFSDQLQKALQTKGSSVEAPLKSNRSAIAKTDSGKADQNVQDDSALKLTQEFSSDSLMEKNQNGAPVNTSDNKSNSTEDSLREDSNGLKSSVTISLASTLSLSNAPLSEPAVLASPAKTDTDRDISVEMKPEAGDNAMNPLMNVAVPLETAISDWATAKAPFNSNKAISESTQSASSETDLSESDSTITSAISEIKRPQLESLPVDLQPKDESSTNPSQDIQDSLEQIAAPALLQQNLLIAALQSNLPMSPQSSQVASTEQRVSVDPASQSAIQGIVTPLQQSSYLTRPLAAANRSMAPAQSFEPLSVFSPETLPNTPLNPLSNIGPVQSQRPELQTTNSQAALLPTLTGNTAEAANSLQVPESLIQNLQTDSGPNSELLPAFSATMTPSLGLMTGGFGKTTGAEQKAKLPDIVQSLSKPNVLGSLQTQLTALNGQIEVGPASGKANNDFNFSASGLDEDLMSSDSVNAQADTSEHFSLGLLSPEMAMVNSAKPSETGDIAQFTSNAAHPVEQVAEGAVYGVNKGHRELIIRLNPDNLGEVRINLISHGNGKDLSARLIASTQEGHAMLESQIDSLKTRLEAQGFQIERLNVVLSGSASQDTNANSQKHSSQPDPESQRSFQQDSSQQQPGQNGRETFGQLAEQFQHRKSDAQHRGGNSHPVSTTASMPENGSRRSEKPATANAHGQINLFA